MRIEGNTIVVTGASAGIGRAVAAELGRAGARVVAVARTAEELEALAGEVPAVVPCPADVTVADDRARIVAEAGAVDVLVNNAGVATVGLVTELEADDVRTMFEVNVLALIDLTMRVLPSMLERRHGHVVNVGSVLGYAPIPSLTVYSATKSAVEGFSTGLRRELTGRGVDVTLVTPGAIDETEVFEGDDIRPHSPIALGFRWAGVGPERVAGAVRDAIERPGWPGYRTLSVPRLAGVARAAVTPGVGWAVDGAIRVLRQVGGGMR